MNVKLSLSGKQLFYRPLGFYLHFVQRKCQLDRHANLKVQEKGDEMQKSCNVTKLSAVYSYKHPVLVQ